MHTRPIADTHYLAAHGCTNAGTAFGTVTHAGPYCVGCPLYE